MGNLASLLGHDVVAAEIADAMEASEDINVLEGPPGVGKSWIAKGIGALWEQGGGTALVAEGDSLQSDTALYPLSFALAGLTPIWRSVGDDLARTGTAGERMGGSTGVITATIQTTLRLRPTRVRARKLFLGDAEQAVLFDLARLAKKRPLLLITDNLHWWDTKSMEFLGRLREPRMCEAFPFLSHLRIIAVQTTEPYQRTSHPQARDALLAKGQTRYHAVRRAERASFASILVEMGAPRDAAERSAEPAYRLTGGHLALAARCALRLQNPNEQDLTALENDDFLERLLTDRLRALGDVGTGALTVLQIAAVLGLTFRRAELVCATGDEPARVAKLLRACRDENMLELSDTVGRFVHDVVRQHFLKTGALDAPTLHDAVAACLKTLRPGDYELRCFHALGAEEHSDAGTFAVLAALRRARDGQSASQLPPYVAKAVTGAELDAVLGTLVRAERARNQADLAACLGELDALPRHLPKPLAAEAELIRAACLIATRDEDGRQAGLLLLQGWEGFEEQEPEIGIRMLHERLYALALDVDKTAGRALESRLRHALADRAAFDRTCEDALYTLDRCSGSLYEPDVSLVRVREATRHFRAAGSDELARRPSELYRCLVNLAAKQLTNAQYEDAIKTHAELESLVADYAEDTFPRLEFPRSTAVLAQFRVGRLTAQEARDRQQEIVSQSGAPGDPFYSENALAVYSLLAGDSDAAFRIYARLRDLLAERARPAPSVTYLLEANLCGALYVTGEHGPAAARWQTLLPVVESIPYTVRRYLIPRHRLIQDVMDDGVARGSAVEFDQCVLHPRQFGPLWDQLGRGFWMPEVEWWH